MFAFEKVWTGMVRFGFYLFVYVCLGLDRFGFVRGCDFQKIWTGFIRFECLG
jgi:hypothetical protein